MSIVRAIGQFVYDFVIGDDWKIAASVVSALAIGALLLVAGVPAVPLVLVTAGLLALAFTTVMVIDVRR